MTRVMKVYNKHKLLPKYSPDKSCIAGRNFSWYLSVTSPSKCLSCFLHFSLLQGLYNKVNITSANKFNRSLLRMLTWPAKQLAKSNIIKTALCKVHSFNLLLCSYLIYKYKLKYRLVTTLDKFTRMCMYIYKSAQSSIRSVPEWMVIMLITSVVIAGLKFHRLTGSSPIVTEMFSSHRHGA